MADPLDLPRIKANVGKMLEQGASREKIYRYIQLEGTTPEAIRGAPLAPQNLDPARVPPRNPPMPFGETAVGNIGEMLYGVPVAGPALLGGAQRLGAAKEALFGNKPYGQALEERQTQQEKFRREHPVMAGSSQAGGATLATMGVGATGPGARALGITGRSLPLRSLASGTTGATIGSADAYVRGNDPKVGAAVGGTFGLVAPATGQTAGKGVREIFGRRARATVAPSLQDLRDSSQRAFQVVDNSGAMLRPAKVNDMLDDIVDVATKGRLNRALHPDSNAAFNEVISYRGSQPTLAELHQLRQIMMDAAMSPKPADRRLAGLMVDTLDEHIDNLNALNVTGPDPRAAVTALNQGMNEWRQMRKGERIAKIFENAKDTVGANYSQAGMQTAIRQQFRQMKKNDKVWRTFSPDEQAAITTVVRGGPVENVLRLYGKFAPQNVISAWPTVAAASMDMGAGAALATTAFGAKAASSAMNLRNARLADEMVRRGQGAPPLRGGSDATRRAVQAGTLGVPLSQYPTLGSPLLPYLPFSESSAREPR